MSIEKTIEANTEAMLALAEAMNRVADALASGGDSDTPAAPDAGDKKNTRKKTTAKKKDADTSNDDTDENSKPAAPVDRAALREEAAALLVRVAKEKSRKQAENLLNDAQKGAKNLKAVDDAHLSYFIQQAKTLLGEGDDGGDDLLG